MNSLGQSVSLISIKDIRKWAEANSMWFYSTGSACCANELIQTQSCKYDLERLGLVEKQLPEQADVLIVYGAVTKKSKPYLLELYNRMSAPRRVIAIGSCACSGGLFARENGPVIEAIESLFHVDVYIPGCPPRPEAIMHGLLKLKESVFYSE